MRHRPSRRIVVVMLSIFVLAWSGCASDFEIDPDDDEDIFEPGACELSDPCPATEFEEFDEDGVYVSVFKSRPAFFDPSTCPTAYVSKMSVLEEVNGLSVRVLHENDFEDDGVFDNKMRVHRTFVDEGGFALLTEETLWFDDDADDVDDRRIHRTYTRTGTTSFDVVYVDEGSDGQVDETHEITSTESVADGLRTSHRVEESDLDIDGVVERRTETTWITEDATGELRQTIDLIVDEDPTQSSRSETSLVSDPALIVYRTEVDIGLDGTIDWIEVSSREDDVTEDGATVWTQRYDRDQDGDGVFDMATEFRLESTPELSRSTVKDDLDADGVFERIFVSDNHWNATTGQSALIREWRDEGGDGVYELISTVIYDDEGKEARRERAHELDGLLSEATYHPDYCGVRLFDDEAP